MVGNLAIRFIQVILEVLGGLVISGALFLGLFVVVLGPLIGYFESVRPTPVWSVAFYSPYLIAGSVSLVRKWRAFGLTLLAAGCVAVIALGGFVFPLSLVT